MKYFQKITIPFLLLLVLLPVLSMVLLQTQRALVREEMKEALEVQQLVTLILPADSLHWIRHNEELLIGGKLFDTKEIKDVGNGKLLIRGIYDWQEDALNEKVAGLMNPVNQEQQNRTIVKWMSNTWCDFTNNTAALPLFVKCNKKKYPNSSAQLWYQVIEIFTPPPKA